MCGPARIPETGAPNSVAMSMTSRTDNSWFNLLVALLLSVAALLAAASAETVVVAADPARRVPLDPVEGPLELGSQHQAKKVHLLLDSLLVPLGATAILDSATLRAVVGLTQPSSRAAATGKWRAWMAPAARHSDSLTTMEYALLRTLARSAPLGSLWGYSKGLGHPRDPAALPRRADRPFMRFAILSERAADSALADGNVEEAMTRARELLAVSRHFTEQPRSADMLIGREFLITGARLMARTARRGNRPVEWGQAIRLAALADAHYSFLNRNVVAMRHLAAEGKGNELLAIASDRELAPALRVQVLESALSSVCLSTSEMLFGATSYRHMLIGQLSNALRDIPRATELTPVFSLALTKFDSDGMAPVAPVRGAARAEVKVVPIRWLVPLRVQNRYRFCQGMA